MTTLRITRGLPASGKTTLARAWVAENPDRRCRINRDDLGRMMHGRRWYHDGNVTEPQITVVQHAAVAALLRSGLDVIVDDTNLRPGVAEALQSTADLAGAAFTMIDLTDVPIDVCVERDASRNPVERVGEDVIRDMWEQHIARPVAAAR